MKIREIINVINENNSGDVPNQTEQTQREIGKDLKKLLNLVNLDVISDNDLAVHIIGTIQNASRREGDSRLDAVATMYGKSNDEDLELDEMQAKVDKLRAEADKIDRS